MSLIFTYMCNDTQTDVDGFQTSNTQYNKCAHNVYVQVKMLWKYMHNWKWQELMHKPIAANATCASTISASQLLWMAS